jgi:kumamolisin
MAPSAQIILVEAASNSLSNLLAAETKAATLVAAAGGGEVSNSWGGGEFPGETSLDSHFIQSGVVFFASTGDFPGTEWPSVAPNVVAAGGTTVSRNPSNLAFITEHPWAETGGGRSLFESIQTYQTSSIVGSSRGVPDVSFDADPDTGVWVFDSTPVQGSTAGCCGVKGWWIVGGLACHRRHWRAWSTWLAISPLPAKTSSTPSTVISEIVRTSTILLLIIAVRLRVSRVKPVGISAPV